MAKPVVVVARYEEDVSWIDRSPWDAFVVQKGEHLPNQGREPASFFWYMATQPISKTGMYAFVQGDPWPHGFEFSDLRAAAPYAPIGVFHYTSLGDGTPHHPGLEVDARYREWLDGPPRTAFPFAAGGQFVVSGRALLQRPPEWYAEMQERMYDGDNPWVMERLWHQVWA